MNGKVIITCLMGTLLTAILGFNTFINTGIRTDIRDVNQDLKLVYQKISSVDERIITHQSNHELHIPRREAVTKEVFGIHIISNEMAYDRIAEIVKGLKDFIIENNRGGNIYVK